MSQGCSVVKLQCEQKNKCSLNSSRTWWNWKIYDLNNNNNNNNSLCSNQSVQFFVNLFTILAKEEVEILINIA